MASSTTISCPQADDAKDQPATSVRVALSARGRRRCDGVSVSADKISIIPNGCVLRVLCHVITPRDGRYPENHHLITVTCNHLWLRAAAVTLRKVRERVIRTLG
ncbi:hypothetical protein EAS64_19570 [Trebonia kvetii]|uniref:Uncharacterized protein n=1 Tax=Trebonia kvetii TaxID=2480626 RepID=A0A6P2C247_9ACTN|nr:hypothetical protein [Trebonia kvetii]TVZ04555.1 hypothetical protein EAS64_19570 [Trebonia kvetii]